jgi:ATP-dependent helicase/nuclease subunit A
MYVKNMAAGILEKITYLQTVCLDSDGPYMYAEAFEEDKLVIEKLLDVDNYDDLYDRVLAIKYKALGRKKDDSVSEEKKDYVKAGRDEYKKQIKTITEKYFFAPFEKQMEELEESKDIISELIDTVIEFQEAFATKKREMNVIDFSDMEHFALDILVKHREDGVVASKVARGFQEYFHEILIDEYQDSNLVQEYLLGSIAKTEPGKNNRFMVGDVKQSIYKFRLARPDLFMDKFDQYPTEKNEAYIEDGDEIRIDLHKNFRSRPEVLEASNMIFTQIMQKDLGGVTYDDDAKLNLGATYPDTEEAKVELLLADMTRFGDGKGRSKDAKEAEARVIAKRIKELVGKTEVFDKDKGIMRPAKYKDMVILLRTNAGWDEVFHKILTEEGVPSYIDSKAGYFSALEVQSVLDFLKILDNPLQDIPLCGSMMSFQFGFTEEELSLIKVQAKRYLKEIGTAKTSQEEVESDLNAEADLSLYGKKLYHAVCLYGEIGEDEVLKERVSLFIKVIDDFRDRMHYEPIHQLIREIYEELNVYAMYSVLSEGEQRKRNLDMLLEKAIKFEQTSYRGLFHFIRYIDQLHKYEVDFGEASVLEESADVVQMLSIHKSKGLEFPICFIAGTAKQLNEKDQQKAFIIEGDLGVGMEYVDIKKHIYKPTLRKNALALKMKMDAFGEELRILYVALTRAKEKLIITGSPKELEKDIRSLGYLLNAEKIDIPFATKIGAKKYLDFILFALCRHRSMENLFASYDLRINTNTPVYNMEPEIKVTVFGEEDLEVPKRQEQIKKELWKNALKTQMEHGNPDEDMEEKIRTKFHFKYPYKQQRGMVTKTTVSQLKMEAMEEEVHSIFEETERQSYVPAFMREEEEISGSLRGSAVHKFLELIAFDKTLNKTEVEELLERYKKNGRMSDEYVAAVLPWKIADFMYSDVARRMIEAKKKNALYKEQPFVLTVSANRVDPSYPEEEKILVQGIIDVFFEEEDGLVVLDYKTDFVKTEEELRERYQTQIDYYAEALEKLTGKKVKEKILYSFALKKSIVLGNT